MHRVIQPELLLHPLHDLRVEDAAIICPAHDEAAGDESDADDAILEDELDDVDEVADDETEEQKNQRAQGKFKEEDSLDVP